MDLAKEMSCSGGLEVIKIQAPLGSKGPKGKLGATSLSSPPKPHITETQDTTPRSK